MTSARDQIVESLKDPAYRRAYVEEHIGQEVAFQLRAMRKDRGWTQNAVAQATGTVQEVISQLEDPDYGRFSLTTLKRMATAFDVDLIVRFAPFSERVNKLDNLGYNYLAVPDFAHDWALTSASVQIANALYMPVINQPGIQTTITTRPVSLIDARTRFVQAGKASRVPWDIVDRAGTSNA